MTKADLIEIVASKADLTKKDTEKVVELLFASIQEALSKGDKVSISGFGIFEARERKERTGRNPKTGEDIVIPSLKTPAFKAGKALKDALK